MAEIHKAMTAILREVGAIGKDKKNAAQGFNFRGIDQVYNELHDLFAKNNVYIMTSVNSYDVIEKVNSKGTTLFYTRLNVTFRFIHEDGSEVSSVMVGEAMDSGDKGMNKAYSIALKYALFQAFLIPTEELKDPDSETHNIDAIMTCIVNIEAAASRDELLQIWRAYPSLQSNAKVKEAFTTAGTKFKQ